MHGSKDGIGAGKVASAAYHGSRQLPRSPLPEGHPPAPIKPASRSGLSLPRSDCPFPDHRSGIFVPGLPLRCHAATEPGPFGAELPSSRISGARGGSTSVTRCQDPLRRSQRFLASSLSFGAVPLRVMARRNSTLQSLLPEMPGFPFAPQRWKYDDYHCGSSLRGPLNIPFRFSVPRTSWNLPHAATGARFRSMKNVEEEPFFRNV